MSPQRARIRTIYWLIALNVVMLFIGGVVLFQMFRLQHRLNVTQDRLAAAEQRNYAGCVRGNVLREGYRFAMKELGSPERAAQPEVREQPCALIYPGGAK